MVESQPRKQGLGAGVEAGQRGSDGAAPRLTHHGGDQAVRVSLAPELLVGEHGVDPQGIVHGGGHHCAGGGGGVGKERRGPAMGKSEESPWGAPGN